MSVDLDLFDASGARMTIGGRTDATGQFEVGVLPAGQYRLRVDPAFESGYARRFYGQSPTVPEGALITVSAIALLAFIYIERRAAEPIIPLHLFKMNVFWTTSIISFIVGAAMFGSVTFLPIYLQIALGVSPTVSGLMLIPMTFGILIASTVSGQIMGRSGKYRILPIMGAAFIIVGMSLLTTIDQTTPTLIFGLYLAIFGMGMGTTFPVLTTAVQNAVPRETLGTATAAGLMFRQVGGSLAVAAFGALFAARLSASLGTEINLGGEIGPQMLAGLPTDVQDLVAGAVVNAIHPVFWCAAGLGVLALLISLILQEVPLKTTN